MLDRNDFAEIADRTLEYFFRSPPEDSERYGIGVTSGTSRNKVLVAIREYRKDDPYFASGPRRMLSCRGSLGTALSNAVFTRFRSRHFRARILILDRTDFRSDIKQLLSDFAPDGMSGFPHIIDSLAQCMNSETRSGITSLEYVGEGLGSIERQRLRKAFPKAKTHMTYTASEVGGIGRSCKHLPENFYHPLTGVVVEVENANESGEGELLISTTLAFGIPVRQYRISDIGTIRAGACACGAPLTFEILGRAGRDYVKLAGAVLRRELFDTIAASSTDLFDDYRAEAYTEEHQGVMRGKIVLRVHRASGGISPKAIADISARFSRDLFVTPTQTLSDVIQKGLFTPLEVVVVDSPFPEEEKEAKIVQRIL